MLPVGARKACVEFKCQTTDLFGVLLIALLSTFSAYAQTVDSFNAIADGNVVALALQNDGKVLAIGGFSLLDGQAWPGIGRLNSDGAIDNTFNSLVVRNGTSVILGVDGKIVLAGSFLLPGSELRTAIGRLNVDGTEDSGFSFLEITGEQGWSGDYTLACQPDGRILLGGSFTLIGGQPCTNLARVNVDGSLDKTFNASVGGVSDYINCIAIQPDAKILIGGNFGTNGNKNLRYLRRLNPDGSLDASFIPRWAAGETMCLVVQPDEEIIASVNPSALADNTSLLRFAQDGELDTNFIPNTYGVKSICLQTDGRMIFCGPDAIMGRINSDGSVDPTFTNVVDQNPIWVSPTLALGPTITCLSGSPDGKVLLGGFFVRVGGIGHTNLARLNNTESATNLLSFDGANIKWLRPGVSPEICFATFDCSTNGSDWASLGNGHRINGGWELPTSTLSPTAGIRARGLVQNGFHQTTEWFIQTTIGRSSITQQPPPNETYPAGSVASFDVVGGGDPPVYYSWQKNGTPLIDGENVYGARTSSLIISNVLFTDSAGYSVIVSNAFGAVTSRVAVLTVIDPFITIQPTNTVGNVGQSVEFDVAAVGSVPLSFQWFRNGTNLPTETRTSLIISNLQVSDNNNLYGVLVSNNFGIARSSQAQLSVNSALVDDFNPAVDGSVNTIALQPDGKIVVGGSFSTLNGQSRSCIARLNNTGSLDTNFNPGEIFTGCCPTVTALVIQPDGSIVVGGDFTTIDGQGSLVRLRADGSRDLGFLSGIGGNITGVHALALQQDGKILVGGNFSTIAGYSHTNLARLNSDGSVDSTFNASVSWGVLTLGVQTDGRIILGGFNGTIDGQSRDFLARLNADGTLDDSFLPTPSDTVFCVAIDRDSKILVGGAFQSLDGLALNGQGHLGRLNPDGTLDTSFNPGVNGPVLDLAIETDGKILVSGQFSALGGQPRSSLGRLNHDGTVDSVFNPEVTGPWVACATLGPDGRMLLSGPLQAVAGQPRDQIARLLPTDPARNEIVFQGSIITWVRSGPLPEVWCSTLEASTNNGDWYFLGSGTRISDGWQVPIGPLPIGTALRFRGYVQGATQDGSTWLAQSTGMLDAFTPPIILVNDAVFGFVSNRFAFNVATLVDQVVVIESSDNFSNWIPIVTNLTQSGIIPFDDAVLPPRRARFYRARIP